MASKTVEVIYGKRYRYEIRRREGFLSPKFTIYRDGRFWKGDYNSLARAVEVAQEDG